MRIKPLLIASAALAVALPALAQQASQPQPSTPPLSQSPTSSEPTSEGEITSATDDSAIQETSTLTLGPPKPPVEYPSYARRDQWTAGVLNPADAGLNDNPWGAASGAFLSTLMRRMDTPIVSRWAHIALRDSLLAKSHAPREVNPVDWSAERAWLLLRMGEADAARMLVASVDSDQFTPKMVQVGVQTALASADPPALCPIEEGIRKYDPGVRALVQAMCASLAGEPESASAMIDDARRHGRIGGIDLTLAEKVVGAGANTGRAVTIEWDPVDRLTAWRFGLATATGIAVPDRLLKASSPQLRAFQARAPLLSPQQRLDSALIAGGLGVLSSQSLVDLYSAVYDSTDPDDLPSTDAWQLRQAFAGRDEAARVAAIRHLLGVGKNPLQKEAMRALVARAASLVTPSADLQDDAPDLIAAMLAAGYDRLASRWAPIVRGMKDANADRCWAMLALASPDVSRADISSGRIASFIGRDQSKGKMRSALLVAGLAGLGRISTDSANSINRRYGLGLGRVSNWTRIINSAAARGQGGTVLVLMGTGFQTSSFDRLPSAHMYHAIAGLERTNQDFSARMIAAEALSRT